MTFPVPALKSRKSTMMTDLFAVSTSSAGPEGMLVTGVPLSPSLRISKIPRCLYRVDAILSCNFVTSCSIRNWHANLSSATLIEGLSTASLVSSTWSLLHLVYAYLAWPPWADPCLMSLQPLHGRNCWTFRPPFSRSRVTFVRQCSPETAACLRQLKHQYKVWHREYTLLCFLKSRAQRFRHAFWHYTVPG